MGDPSVDDSTTGLRDELLKAIDEDDFNYFHKVLTDSGGLWREIRTNSGDTLLQETIRRSRWHMFKHILKISDVEYLEKTNDRGDTALTTATRLEETRMSCVIVPELLEKYGNIPIQYHNAILGWALWFSSEKTITALFENGMDLNLKETTALQDLIMYCRKHGCYECIFASLLYKADPFFKYNKCNAFELTVLERRTPQMQELLFVYTFDQYRRLRINFKVLLELARQKSPLFHRILEYPVDFVSDDLLKYENNVRLLLSLELGHLKILLEKQFSAVCDTLRGASLLENLSRSFLDRISFLIESSPILRDIIASALADEPSHDFFRWVATLQEPEATKTVRYLSFHGLRVPEAALDLVYKSYGFCPLFQFMLNADLQPDDSSQESILVVSLMRDVRRSLKWCMRTPTLYGSSRLLDVLDFFAGRKVKMFLRAKIKKEKLVIPERDLVRLRNHPNVCSLQELARNTCRGHLIRKFKIKTLRQLVSVSKYLKIAPVHIDIITLQLRLY